MSKTPYARTSLTLPPGLLAEADRLAREWGRSRSWVIAKALEALVRTSAVASDRGSAHGANVPEPTYQRAADQLLGFETLEAYRQWRDRTRAVSTPLDPTRLERIRQALEQQGARYHVEHGHPPSDPTTAAPVLLRIGTDIANARGVLRGLHQAGFALAHEIIAEAMVARAAIVVGVDPRVDVLVVADPREAEDRAPPSGGEGVNPT